jgi:hypothetical protein
MAARKIPTATEGQVYYHGDTAHSRFVNVVLVRSSLSAPFAKNLRDVYRLRSQ